MLSLFRNEFNKCDNTHGTGARMIDSIYHMTLELNKKSHFLSENVTIVYLLVFVIAAAVRPCDIARQSAVLRTTP